MMGPAFLLACALLAAAGPVASYCPFVWPSQDEKLAMAHPEIELLDQFDGVYGLRLPERLFYEAFVMQQDIEPKNGCDRTR